MGLSNIEQFVKEAYLLFSGYERPIQCIDHQGDPEYKDHKESLTNITRSTLDMTHIGNAGWHPINALG